MIVFFPATEPQLSNWLHLVGRPSPSLQGLPRGSEHAGLGLSPAPHYSAANGLFQDLPAILRKVADLRGIVMLGEQPGRLGGDVYDQESLDKHPLLCIRFTDLQPFMEATFSEPRKLKVPLSEREAFTSPQRDGKRFSFFPKQPLLAGASHCHRHLGIKFMFASLTVHTNVLLRRVQLRTT